MPDLPAVPVISGRMLLPHLRRIQSDTLGFIMDTTRRSGDLVLAMGAGDVNGLWERLNRLQSDALELVA